MAVNAVATDRESRVGPDGELVADKLRTYRELTITDTRKDGHQLMLYVWDDGTFQVESFSGWDEHTRGLSEAPAQFKPADAPDVALAITEWLGSL